MEKENEKGELIRYLRAMVFLQAHALAGDDEKQKPELLLSRAGLTAREISDALGKSQAAVSKAIERAKKAVRAVPDQPLVTSPEESAPELGG